MCWIYLQGMSYMKEILSANVATQLMYKNEEREIAHGTFP